MARGLERQSKDKGQANPDLEEEVRFHLRQRNRDRSYRCVPFENSGPPVKKFPRHPLKAWIPEHDTQGRPNLTIRAFERTSRVPLKWP